VLQLDLALADYGPEANPERAALRDRLGKTIDQVWGAKETDAYFAANSFASAIRVMRDPEKAVGNLRPSTDEQRQALAAAKSDIEAIGQSRAADVLRPDRAYFLSASSDRGRLGVLPILRIWSDVTRRRDVSCYTRCWRYRGRERRAVDSRPFKSLLRCISRLLRSARTGVGGDGQGVSLDSIAGR
jgi:hypothetical protein